MERAYDAHVVRLKIEGPAEEASRPSRPVTLVDSTGGRLKEVTTLRLGHGHRLAVEEEARPAFDFYGGSFYQASRELSAKLPTLGLTALQYNVWHTLLGVQLKGGIIPMTQKKIAERLHADRKEVGEAIRIFRSYGLLYTPGRGRICLNPRIAFYGDSRRQEEALADMLPHDVPVIELPSGYASPRSRKARTGPKGV